MQASDCTIPIMFWVTLTQDQGPLVSMVLMIAVDGKVEGPILQNQDLVLTLIQERRLKICKKKKGSFGRRNVCHKENR